MLRETLSIKEGNTTASSLKNLSSQKGAVSKTIREHMKAIIFLFQFASTYNLDFGK